MRTLPLLLVLALFGLLADSVLAAPSPATSTLDRTRPLTTATDTGLARPTVAPRLDQSTFGFAGPRPRGLAGVARPTRAPRVALTKPPVIRAARKTPAAVSTRTTTVIVRSKPRIVVAAPVTCAPCDPCGTSFGCSPTTCSTCCPTNRDKMSVPTAFWSSGYHDGDALGTCDPCASTRAVCDPCDPCTPTCAPCDPCATTVCAPVRRVVVSRPFCRVRCAPFVSACAPACGPCYAPALRVGFGFPCGGFGWGPGWGGCW